MNWLNETLIVILSLCIFISSLFLWKHSKEQKYKKSNLILSILSGITLIMNIIIEVFIIHPLNIKFGLYGVPLYLGTVVFCSLTLPCIISEKFFKNAFRQFQGQTTKTKETLIMAFEPLQFSIFVITNLLGAILIALFISVIISHPHVNPASFFALFSAMVKRFGVFFADTTLFFELGWNICVICIIISSVLGTSKVLKIYLLKRAILNLKIKEQNEFIERLAKFNLDVNKVSESINIPLDENVIDFWKENKQKFLAEKAIPFKDERKENKSHSHKKHFWKRKKKK